MRYRVIITGELELDEEAIDEGKKDFEMIVGIEVNLEELSITWKVVGSTPEVKERIA